MLEYDLELERASAEIRKINAKLVCIQLPDGLKPKAKEIEESLAESTGAEILIWAGSCFGVCDIPVELEKIGVDLVIQWGHNELAPGR
ncbi:MAG TPA: diphthamide synthesis protein [Candidatus Nanoarchaeia archaeon]|nr:diphthamide synthesis protein [Candidatus Nanoarchaeia archaeon]